MKQSLKLLELLEESIDRQVENGIYEIERDLLLERLRGIYATVVASEAVAEEERVLDALMGIGAASAVAYEEPEIEIERLCDEEPVAMYGCPYTEYEVAPEEQEEVSDSVEPEEELEPKEENVEEEVAPVVEEPEEEPIVEEEIAESEQEPAAEEQKEPAAEEIDHEAVLSLYDDEDEEEEALQEVAPEEPAEEIAEPEIEEISYQEPEEEFTLEPEEEPEEEVGEEPEEEDFEEVEPKEEPTVVVLGDVLSSEPTTTLADNLAEQMNQDVATAASASLSLREAIGINDKYILLRDLFAGDNDYYEQAIERLDSFDSLDEAMLYIYDHFHWNPNSEGARLLMELLARKLF